MLLSSFGQDKHTIIQVCLAILYHWGGNDDNTLQKHPVLHTAANEKMNVTQMEASAPTDPSNVETDIEFVSWT